MLYYDKTDVSGGINVNKTTVSRECCSCHYWHFLNYSSNFQPNVCNRCHDLLMMSTNLSDIGLLSIKRSDYRCLFSLITINKNIKLLQNADLTEKSKTT